MKALDYLFMRYTNNIPMQLSAMMVKNKQLIDERLIQLLDQYRPLLSKAGSFGSDVINQIKKRITKGKTIRGSLLLFSAEAFGYPDLKSVLDCAAALEIIQLGILIHDDIMDQDEVRRGMSTVHAEYRKHGVSDTAESLAVCVGDILFFMASDVIADSALSSQTQSRLQHEFSRVLMQTGVSQMDDVYFAGLKKGVSETSILRLYEYKTAQYTFSLPLVSGALIAGKKTVLKTLRLLGTSLGILFQIQDDVLDFFGSDIREHKKTLIHALLFSRANTSDGKVISTLSNRDQLTGHDLGTFRRLMRKYAIDEYINTMKQRYIKQALGHIVLLPILPSYKQVLIDLTGQISNRKK